MHQRATRVLLTLLILVTCRLSAAAATQERTHGQRGVIVDESGGAIAGARLVVRTSHGGVVQQADTAADGTFTIDPLSQGTYWLEVTAPQFRSRQVSIRFEDETQTSPLRIVLSLAALQSDITVTAQRGMIAEIDRT